MVVRFCVIFMFMLNLSATTGKYSFVIAPFVVRSNSRCHVSTLISLSSSLHWDFLVALYKVRMRRCLLCKSVSQLVPLDPDVSFNPAEFNCPICSHLRQFLPYSMRNVWFVLFLRESNVIWLSVYMVAVLSSVYVFCVLQCS